MNTIFSKPWKKKLRMAIRLKSKPAVGTVVFLRGIMCALFQGPGKIPRPREEFNSLT